MLRITVELVSARTGETKLLGVGTIANDGNRSAETEGKRGAYAASFSKWAPKENEVWVSGKVPDFDRLKRGPWDLLFVALRAAVGKRNP